MNNILKLIDKKIKKRFGNFYIYKIIKSIIHTNKLKRTIDKRTMKIMKVGETIKEYDHLFSTIYANYKNEWLDYIDPTLRELENLKNPARILDVGCGIGHLLCQLDKMGFDVSGIDFSKEAIDRIPDKNLNVVYGNSKILPWNSDYFNFVCSMGAFEHYVYDVFDLLETFKEIHRVLKPGGVFGFLVPCYENSTEWNAIYKEGYKRNAIQLELGWNWNMWKRCVELFNWEGETIKKVIKHEKNAYIYMYMQLTGKTSKNKFQMNLQKTMISNN